MAVTTTIDSVDHSANIRLADFVVVEMAYGGEVGLGGFKRDDLSLGDVPALKYVSVVESAASPTRMFSGYTGVRNLDRGVLGRVDSRRQWDVTVLDGNTILDDEVFQASTANRPAETDYARITWLLTTGAMSALGVTAGVVPNTNTVNMDATDYRHRGPRDVLSDCAEQASKNYFIYDYTGAGWLLYYDLATGTSLTSGLTLSSVASDVDSSTCWALINPRLSKDPSRIYSAVDFGYAGGFVYVDDPAIETAFRRREIAISNTDVKSSTAATNRANAYLAKVGTELKTFLASVQLPAAKVNDIRAGQRIQVKCPHLDVSAFTYMRISRREVIPQSSEQYLINLEFAEDLLPARFGDIGEDDDDETGEVTDNAAVTLALYQGSEEIGSGYFGPFAGAWERIDPDPFSLGTISAAVDGIVHRSPQGNISWPYTDCGVGTGGVAGLASGGVWHRFTVDLSDDALVGVRFTVEPFIVTGSGYTESPSGFLVGEGTVICGIDSGTASDGSDLGGFDSLIEVGRVGDQGGTVFVPRSLLIDNGAGYNWFVLAPGWIISSDLFFCNTAGDKPYGYGKTGHTSNNSQIVSGVTVLSTGSTGGESPWLPADGVVDGSNKDFELPLWNGEGVPEVRVGLAELNGGEFTYDGGVDPPTVSLLEAPPAYMEGQVFYRGPV